MAARYRLPGTEPSPDPRHWCGIRITAAGLASFRTQALADPRTGPFLTSASCCLGGVVPVHSVGFTDDEIVVVLSTAAPTPAGWAFPR